MPPILRPIGFDVPAAPGVEPQAPNQLPQPDTTGLQVMSQAGQRMEQTLQMASQSYQVQAKAVQQISESASQSARAQAEASAQAAQLRATYANQTAQTIGNLGETIMRTVDRYSDYKQKQDANALKQFQDAQKAAATKDLEDLRVNWIEGGEIQKQGTQAYRDALAATIGKYQLSSDDIANMTERYYSPAVDWAKQTEANRQKTAEEVSQQTRRINASQLRGKISASLGNLAASAGLGKEQVELASRQVTTNINEFMKDENIPLIDRLTAVADALEQHDKYMFDRNKQTTEWNIQATNTRTLTAYAYDQMAKVAAGEQSISTAEANIKMRGAELRVVGFDMPDPLRDMKFQRESQETSLAIQEGQRRQYLNDLQTVEANDAVVMGLATQLVLDDTAYQALRTKKPEELDVNAKVALQRAEQFRKWRDTDVPEYNRRRLKLNTDVEQIRGRFDAWLVDAQRDSTRATQVPSFSKLLDQARAMGDPTLLSILQQQPQGKPLTTEQYDIMRDAALRQIDTLVQQSRNEDSAYANQVQQFRKWGLSLDVNEMKAANQAAKGKVDQYRQILEQARQQQLQPVNIPGQSPNFNGGAPGKPLSRKPLGKGTYAGQQITFPFDRGAVARIPQPSQGMLQGASRDGGARRHAGLDFDVPVGTPTTSLVYGRVKDVAPNGEAGGYGMMIDIEGDNGRIYRYAHLSKSKVVVGQRVGPGEVIALSGNTGVGTGPHLHLEVMDKQGNRLDVLAHLSSQAFGDSSVQPRTAGNQRPSNLPPVFPKGAIPLGNNQYLVGSKVVKASYTDFTTAEANAKYSQAAPIRNSYAGSKTGGVKNPAANHGYGVLAKDVEFAKAINNVAARHNIPGEWLADLIAKETGGSFSRDIRNDWGYVGLIQFGSAAAQDLGVTQDQLASMTRVQQMQYVDKYLTLQKRYAGIDQFRNIAELAAAVQQGHTVLKDVRRRGAAAVNDPENRDGAGVTLKEYLRRMGQWGGRQYDFPGNRANRVSSVIHTRPSGSCAMCIAMLNNGNLSDFLPHESQGIA